MENFLSAAAVTALIKKAEESFRHQECTTCECYLGYLTQLEIDADPDGQQILWEYQPEREEIHACLGCDSCPPGILYATYLRKRPSRQAGTNYL
jgi:hypothetical protein